MNVVCMDDDPFLWSTHRLTDMSMWCMGRQKTKLAVWKYNCILKQLILWRVSCFIFQLFLKIIFKPVPDVVFVKKKSWSV